MDQFSEEHQIDIKRDEVARVLHRVVRAMHDGHCPSCGYLAPAEQFYRPSNFDPENMLYGSAEPLEGAKHCCPRCGFTVTEQEASAALAEFRPYLQKSVAIFEQWRASRKAANLTIRNFGESTVDIEL